MNVLSLFDGCSCGQVALERAGIKVDNYFACEIKKHAIKCTQYNYPDTIQLGDIKKLDITTLPTIDLVIGGSPCQDISHLKPGCNIHGEKSSLFFDYHRIYTKLKKKNPKIIFLLENVLGDNNSLNIITSHMGVFPHYINSSMLSYQNRKRLYWTDVYFDGHVKDINISFQDYKEIDYDICKEYKVNKTPSRVKMWGDGINGKCPNVTHRDKINCLTTRQDRWGNAGLVEFEDFCRYLTVGECEQGQTLPIGYTECLTRNQAYDVIGDGWTVDVIAHILKGIKD